MNNPSQWSVQQGSFQEPAPIVPAHPEASPLVCIKLNQDWIPVVCGALMQLVQNTTWDTTDPAVQAEAVGAATDLIAMVSNAKVCPPVRFRLRACVLEFSEDGGVSWSAVEGWSTYAPGCFDGPAGPAGPAGPTGPAGAEALLVSTTLLDYVTTTDLAVGAAIPQGVWTDIVADQAFTVPPGGALVEIAVGGNFRIRGAAASTVAPRVVVDATSGSPVAHLLGGALDADVDYPNALAGSALVPIGFLAAGVHTVRLQAQAVFSDATYYLRSATYPLAEFINIMVYGRASAGVTSGPAGPAGPVGPAGPAGAIGPAGSPCDCTPPVPPNVRSEPSPQRACDIAAFLVSDFIKGALQNTIDGINAGRSILNIFTAVVVALPFDVPVDIGVAALNGLYTVLTTGTLADFEAAEADGALWAGLTCSVFHAIQDVGYVDATNFAAVESAICSYSYAHPDVISALCSFVSNLGLSGVQTLQSSGALATGDCSGCGAWCYAFDFTASNGHWSALDIATWAAPQGWTATTISGGSGDDIHRTFAATNITRLDITWAADCINGSALRQIRYIRSGVTLRTDDLDGGSHPGGTIQSFSGWSVTADEIQVYLRSDGPGCTQAITRIQVYGTGACPFGPPNC